MLHGYSDSLRSFDLLLQHVPDTSRVIVPTQRGHGDSSRPDSGYGPGEFSSDLAAFMDTLEIESAIIVGHSMGTLVAERFALDHPERTLGLVLIGAHARLKNVPDFDEISEMVGQLEDPVDPDLLRGFQESTFAGDVPPAFFETVVQESAKVPADVWKKVLRSMAEDDHSDRLSRISVPTLILWGDQDDTAPRGDQDILPDRIPDATLEVYPGTGHALHWEEPERAAGHLRAFVDNVRAALGRLNSSTRAGWIGRTAPSTVCTDGVLRLHVSGGTPVITGAAIHA